CLYRQSRSRWASRSAERGAIDPERDCRPSIAGSRSPGVRAVRRARGGRCALDGDAAPGASRTNTTVVALPSSTRYALFVDDRRDGSAAGQSSAGAVDVAALVVDSASSESLYMIRQPVTPIARR